MNLYQQRKRVLQNRLLPRLTRLASVALVAMVGPAFADPKQPVATIGEPAPSFLVQDREKRWQSWTDFRDKNGLIFVFGTVETLDELFGLRALEPELREARLPILLIDVTCGQKLDQIHESYRAYSLGDILRFDPRGSVSQLYEVPGVPFVVVTDQDLVIRYMGGLGRNSDETATVEQVFKSVSIGHLPDIATLPTASAARFRPQCGSP